MLYVRVCGRSVSGVSVRGREGFSSSALLPSGSSSLWQRLSEGPWGEEGAWQESRARSVLLPVTGGPVGEQEKDTGERIKHLFSSPTRS